MRDFIQQYPKFIVPAALLLVVLLAIAARADFRTESENPSPSTALQPSVEIRTNTAPKGIVRTGYVTTPVLLPIHSGFAGFVSEIYIKEGQVVKAGQPLFKLETASGDAATSGPAPAENALHDYKKLYELGIISRREFENSATRKGVTPQNSRNRQSAAATTAIVKAPIEGVVTALAAAAGNVVQADQRILSLGSGQPVEIVVPLSQEDLYWVQLGMPVTIEASGNAIRGEVASIFPEVKNNVLVSFHAHIQLTHPSAGSLRIGMPVTVRMDTGP